jgi:hypothetical protein
LNDQQRLAERLQRRYWIFASDVAELKYGISALTWTTNKRIKAEQLTLLSPHTHNYLLDTRTGEYWARMNGSLIQIDLVKILKNNQKEYKLL